MPTLLYGVTVFDNCGASSKHRLQTCFKKIVRYIYDLKRTETKIHLKQHLIEQAQDL